MLPLASVGFFKTGEAWAVLKCEGKGPLENQFTIDVIGAASQYSCLLSWWGSGLSQMTCTGLWKQDDVTYREILEVTSGVRRVGRTWAWGREEGGPISKILFMKNEPIVSSSVLIKEPVSCSLGQSGRIVMVWWEHWTVFQRHGTWG